MDTLLYDPAYNRELYANRLRNSEAQPAAHIVLPRNPVRRLPAQFATWIAAARPQRRRIQWT